MIETLRRPNQLERRSEGWRPPPFRPVQTRWDRLAASVRRLVDLQARSIGCEGCVPIRDWHGQLRARPDAPVGGFRIGT